LTDLLREAINIGAEIPEITGFDEHNAALYVKVNVNNSGERTANASDFYFTINYQSEPGSSSVIATYGSDAGVIVRLPPSTFALLPQRLDTGDPAKNSLLDSFNRYDFCNGKIQGNQKNA
jgi:hypothetical protein